MQNVKCRNTKQRVETQNARMQNSSLMVRQKSENAKRGVWEIAGLRNAGIRFDDEGKKWEGDEAKCGKGGKVGRDKEKRE